MGLPLPLVATATLAAAAPFRMVFKRLPKEGGVDGARRAARVAAVHRQRDMLKDEHCLVDAVNTTLKTTRDMLDWGGSDQLFAKWWEEHVVDFTLSSENCKSRDFAKCLEGRWRKDGVTALSHLEDKKPKLSKKQSSKSSAKQKLGQLLWLKPKRRMARSRKRGAAMDAA